MDIEIDVPLAEVLGRTRARRNEERQTGESSGAHVEVLYVPEPPSAAQEDLQVPATASQQTELGVDERGASLPSFLTISPSDL